MEEKLKLIEELYDITVRQEKAINLGLIPRFMRLIEERDKVIKKIEELTVEKEENLMYDEIENKIKELSNDIIELDKKNLEELSKLKKKAKIDVENIINTKKVIFDTYDRVDNTVGNYFDDKQ